MWTTSHCFDFFLCNLMYIVSICENYRPTHEKTNILLDQLQKHFFLVISHVPGGGGGTIIEIICLICMVCMVSMYVINVYKKSCNNVCNQCI